MSQPAKKRKPPGTPQTLAELRWKGKTDGQRIAETTAARAARWPKCAACGLTEAQGPHDVDREGMAHYFEPNEK